MLKKILSVSCLLSLTMSLLSGCGANGTNPPEGDKTASDQTPVSASPSENTSGGEKIKITYLNGFTGGDGAFMKKITEGFNGSQDKYFIEELQEKDHYIKFKSDSYDIVVMHGDLLKTYMDDGLISDLTPIYESTGITINDFHKAAESFTVIDGKPYAFPLDIHPLTMFYNKNLVETEPKTYQDLLDLNKKLQEQDKNLYATGIPSGGLVEFFSMALAVQNNIDLSNGSYMNYDNEEFIDVLLKYNEMVLKDKISPENLGLDGEFKAFMQETEGGTSVQTAIALTGPWYYSAALEKYGDALAVAPIPVIGTGNGTYGNAHTIAVSSNVTDASKLEGIGEFFKYMFTPENLINWAESGQAPLHLKTIELVSQTPEKYPLVLANIAQFDSAKIAPPLYNVREQAKYLNENVFPMVVSTPNVTREQIKAELVKATQFAKEISEE